MGCCKHGNTDGDCMRCEEEFVEEVDAENSRNAKRIAALEAENAELRAALYDEKHGISFHARDAILQRWQDHGRQLMASHRAQLPSEARDLYGGGCGCNQCEEVRALFTPNLNSTTDDVA